tara:strand:- start:3109 stop:3429 length:321 start_codon:yes stop_codon:yes gene_type:complete
MPTYVNRYEDFSGNGGMKPIPGLKIPMGLNDKKVLYKIGETRLDILSQKYYNNAYHGWLIMLANPKYGGLEFNIPNGEVIRIPFPFNSAVERYLKSVETYNLLYGE